MLKKIKTFYEEKYKTLMVIQLVLLLLSVAFIGFTKISTGDYVQKDVSLSGGIVYNVKVDDWNGFSSSEITEIMKERFPDNSFQVIDLKNFGERVGFSLSVDIDGNNLEFDESFKSLLDDKFNDNYVISSKSSIGASIAENFFRSTFKFLIYAFIAMGIVVFLYFREPVPSLAVILSAFTDIMMTFAIFNILGLKLSQAGIAAFLMLVGYSVDTDILLTTKVIKDKPKKVMPAVYDAMKTGLKMTLTTIGVVFFVLIFSQAESIKQIMVILLIGLFVDLLSTWFMNAGILRMYLEKKHAKKSKLVKNIVEKKGDVSE